MKTRHTHAPSMARTAGRLVAAGLLLSALSITATTAIADQLVPHHASASGHVISSKPLPDGFHNLALGQGVGTYEGQFTEVNEFDIRFQWNGSAFETLIAGTLTVVTANGDSLNWEFSSVTPGLPDPSAPFPFVATPNLVGGTGRFEGATGSATTQGILYPEGRYEYVADGLISSIGSNLTN